MDFPTITTLVSLCINLAIAIAAFKALNQIKITKDIAKKILTENL